MAKIKMGKKNIEYLYTKNINGQIIRVYQVDNDALKYGEPEQLSLPILVTYMGGEESIVDILDERTKLRNEIAQKEDRIDFLRNELNKYYPSNYSRLKKWWQFWKKY